MITAKRGDAAPPLAKLLPPHFKGVVESEEAEAEAVKALAEVQKFWSVPHPKAVFCQWPRRQFHPMDTADHLEGVNEVRPGFCLQIPRPCGGT